MTRITLTRKFSSVLSPTVVPLLILLLAVTACSDTKKVPPREEDKMLKHQEAEMDRQGREYEDLQRQKYHDEKFRKKYGTPPVEPTE